jgi:hypothetical protein
MSLENPMPGGQTPPTGAPQPVQPVYPSYPTYPHPGYPGYPMYGSHPYYGYAAAAHAGPPVLPPVPSRAPDRPARQRLSSFVVAIVLVVATVGALALASAAPSLVARDPGPASILHQVYSASLHDYSTDWDVTNGCAFEYGGLHAISGTSPTLCTFMPSKSTDYTSGGFYLTTQLAPPGAFNTLEGACVHFSFSGSIVTFAIDSNGTYSLNTDSGYECSTVGAPQQATAAWHGGGYVPNTISLSYDSSAKELTAYLNGQQILQQGLQLSGQYAISLGTPPTGNDSPTDTGVSYEVIYTSFGLWSQS